jgi:radical SAM superfamily enzyme YgiQ (UPF0313 family)
VAAAREALTAGFDHVNLDLIYGTPGESDDDLVASLDAAVDAGVDHVRVVGSLADPKTRSVVVWQLFLSSVCVSRRMLGPCGAMAMRWT